jgi:hypothetical protein
MKFSAFLLAFSLCTFGTPRIETVKVVRPDTLKTVIITYDTLLITKTFKDTSLLVRVDTTDPKKAVKKVK